MKKLIIILIVLLISIQTIKAQKVINLNQSSNSEVKNDFTKLKLLMILVKPNVQEV